MAVTVDKKAGQNYYYNAAGNRRTVFAAGAIAGMVMTVAMWLLLVLGVSSRTVANLIADKIASIVPASFTESIIQAIGPLGKELVFFGVLIGQVLFGGLLGLVLSWLWPRIENRSVLFRNAFILATAVWFLFMLVGLPLTDSGFLGSSLGENQISLLITSFILFQIFGLAFGFLFEYLVPVTVIRADTAKAETISATVNNATEEETEEEYLEGSRSSRRRFVAIASTFFVAALAGAVSTNLFKGSSASTYRTSLGEVRPDGMLEGEVTPTESFYQVSKNAFNPKVNGTNWKMEINGLVNKTLIFDFDGIKKLPSQLRYHTLTCISNTIGGEYIGNAQWKGTPLKGILEQAGLKPGVKKVVFTCADGYTDSIPIEVALDPRTLLAYEMNGQQLTDDHGYPARMLIPDIYGMKNAKWVTSITVIDTEFDGFWQKQGWDNKAQIQTESAITFPFDGGQIGAGKAVTLKGFAFAGARGIKKVEVSTDNGNSWLEATVKPPLSDTSWAIWRADWTVPGGSKNYVLKVRATDGTGAVQTSQRADSFPSGATGYHTISVKAS